MWSQLHTVRLQQKEMSDAMLGLDDFGCRFDRPKTNRAGILRRAPPSVMQNDIEQ